MIGLNCLKVFELVGILVSDKGGFFVINIFVRWVIMGFLYMCSIKYLVVSCCRVVVKEVGLGKYYGYYFMVKIKVREMVIL